MKAIWWGHLKMQRAGDAGSEVAVYAKWKRVRAMAPNLAGGPGRLREKWNLETTEKMARENTAHIILVQKN